MLFKDFAGVGRVVHGLKWFGLGKDTKNRAGRFEPTCPVNDPSRYAILMGSAWGSVLKGPLSVLQ